MAIPKRTIQATCDIDAGTLDFGTLGPVFTGENAAADIQISLRKAGSAYSPSGVIAELYLYWPGTPNMSETVQLTVSGSTVTGSIPDSLTVLPGCPLLVLQLTNGGTGELIVAAAAPISITRVRGNLIVSTRPPTPSEIIYVGRAPYVGQNGHWYEWNSQTMTYIDTGITAKGDKGDKGDPGTASDTTVASNAIPGTSNVHEALVELNTRDSQVPGTEVEPYVIRQTDPAAVDHPYKREKLIGGTVAWNQLINLVSYTNQQTDTRNYARLQFLTRSASESITYCNVNKTGFCSFVFSATIAGTNNTGFSLRHNGSTTNLDIYENQNVNILNGHKYLFSVYSESYDPTTVGGIKLKNFMLFDLTQMFGTEIADYIYNLEQATEGAGVIQFRSLFPVEYYPYNVGQLMSVMASGHKTTGKNLFDLESFRAVNVTRGSIAFTNDGFILTANENDAHTGFTTSDFPSKCVIPVREGQKITLSWKANNNNSGYVYIFGNGTSKSYEVGNNAITKQVTYTVPEGITFITYRFGVGSTGNSIKYYDIQIEISETATEYEPHWHKDYALDSNLELRGIPQLVSNKLMYDGDEYGADGNVKRKYGIVNLGTLTWNKTTYANVTMFTAPIASVNHNTGDLIGICSKYKYTDDLFNSSLAVNNPYSIAINNAGNTIYAYDPDYNDNTAFKAAMSGVYFVYELTYETEEQALPFYSAMKCDSAGIEEWIDERTVAIPVGHETEYLGETLGEASYAGAGYQQGDALIDKRIDNLQNGLAYVENGDTSSRAYAVGDILIWKDEFFNVISSISGSGVTFTVGGNVAHASVAGILNELRQLIIGG